jgi:hypothetical protein
MLVPNWVQGSEGAQTYIVKADDHDRVLVLARQIRVEALEEVIHRVDNGREVAIASHVK